MKSLPRPFMAVRGTFVLAIAVLFFCLVAMGLPLMADDTAPAPAAGNGSFSQYLVDHQDDLSPFFSQNAADFIRLAVPMLMGMLTWVIVITMVVGWATDVAMSRGFAYFFAPAFAELKRSVIYATGSLFLSSVYLGLLCLCIVVGLKFTFAGVVVPIAVIVLLLVALAAQLVWILYIYRTNFAVSVVFYLAVAVAHLVVFLLVLKPVAGTAATMSITDFVDQAITPRLKAEAEATQMQLVTANSGSNSVKSKVTDLQAQIAQDQTDSENLSKEIEAKKNSDIYVFSLIVQARARGELASARDQLTDFVAKYPTSAVNELARTQLAEVTNQLSVQTEQKKEADAETAHDAAVAQADLLARAAKGQATLSEMRKALIGKSRSDVGKLLGLPTDTGSDTWNYRQRMIVNPLTNQQYGLTVYFSEGTVQGVDYN